MKRAATRTASTADLFSQILVNKNQLAQELDISQKSMAHCEKSEVVGNRRLPQQEGLINFLAGVSPPYITLCDQNRLDYQQVACLCSP